MDIQVAIVHKLTITQLASVFQFHRMWSITCGRNSKTLILHKHYLLVHVQWNNGIDCDIKDDTACYIFRARKSKTMLFLKHY
jgi:hypothetical protein